MNKNNDTIKILWTGGWDSTYRIVELSRKKCTIQPIYVFGDNRNSQMYEIRAMKKILKLLVDKKETKATFLPIQFVDKETIPLNKEITLAYNKIHEETDLGSQHEWLARLAKVYPNLELGTELAPLEFSNILRSIKKFGKIKKYKYGYVMDPNYTSEEGMLIFGNFIFPIINKNGQEMLSNIEKWGYNEIMENVWICHTPINGKPCGLCHPCELKIETGMSCLLSEKAVERYKNREKKFNKIVYMIERKISSLILEKI